MPSALHDAIDVLLLSAYAPELEGMRPLLGEALHGELHGIRVAGETVGIGLPNATAGTTTRLLRLRPRAVVLVGTCGHYPNVPLALGQAVVARRALLVDPTVIEGRSALPDPIGRVLDCDPSLTRGIETGHNTTHDVANTLAVTTDDDLAARLGTALGGGVENLEAFGVANACALVGVPFACVLGVSNVVGSRGREQWRAHHKEAARRACERIERWLDRSAPGLPPR